MGLLYLLSPRRLSRLKDTDQVFRAQGTALDWPDAKKQARLVREWGIKQLLEIWNKAKNKERDALLWGDEVEYLVVKYDEEESRVLLSLRQADILQAFASDKDLVPGLRDMGDGELQTGNFMPVFHPEFGRFMLEATPGQPWGIELKDLLSVEPDMRLRREIAKNHMLANEYPITLTTFPRLGSPGVFTSPPYPVSGPKLRSQFVPDEIANPHIRFPTLAANIRSRRGRKVQVNVPVFRDSKTPWPWKDPTVDHNLHGWPEDDDVRNGAAPDNFIHMDAMVFGMGSCCLQITFQAKNITEGRQMYDQLSPLGPIMLALTAATPVYKGFLADTDVRWNQISKAVDDRTPEELGEKPLKHDRWRIRKSRYASNSTYISTDPRLRREYLDPDLVVDPDIKQQLLDGGMDDLLATHFAHLFIRDPLVVFAEDLERLDLDKTDHFENIQSTNWQHMRFKPPPADNSIGWRVEFRPMEIQMTDFENAAFSVFVVLVTRAILSFGLNFYLPIRLVDENMETAHQRDAVNGGKLFYFRKDPFLRTRPTTTPTTPAKSSTVGSVEDEYRLMSIDEVINGTAAAEEREQTAEENRHRNCDHNHDQDKPIKRRKQSHDQDGEHDFPGLVPLVESYLDSVNVDVSTRCGLDAYLSLIRRRASGESWTAARWIRKFVETHPSYGKDSAVTEKIVQDLVGAVVRLGEVEAGRWLVGQARWKGCEGVVPWWDELLGNSGGG